MPEKLPSKLVFKLVAFVTQVFAYDEAGQEMLYVYQRYFKIKEKIDIYNNHENKQKLYEVNADRIIDFSPIFSITDTNGSKIGSIKRYGWKSILKGYYEIFDSAGILKYKIIEANPIIKFIDSLLEQIPLVGPFCGLFLHPEYTVLDTSEKEIARIKKSLSWFERIFDISENALPVEDKPLVSISLIMLALMQRKTG